MSCIKKFKYIILILLFGFIVEGYFILEYELITSIGNSKEESLGYYKIIASRDTYFSELIQYFRESESRNTTLTMQPRDLDHSSNTTDVSSIDYF